MSAPDVRLYKHFNRILYDAKMPMPNRSMANVSRRFTRVGDQIFRRLFEQETTKNVPSTFNKKHIAENVFFSSMTNLERMLRRRDYYTCNAELFLYYVADVCAKSVMNSHFGDGRLQEYILSSHDLLKKHSIYISKNGFEYGIWRSEYTEFFRLFSSSQKLIRYEPVADSNIGIASLRLCIESRIRGAIGIIGVYSPLKNEVHKINMSTLLSHLTRHQGDIQIEVELSLIRLIYGWSNNFIHASYATYPWLVPFAHDVLRPMFSFAKNGDSMDLYASIRMKKNILTKIRSEILQPFLDQDAKCYIYGSSEESCFVGLTP